MAKTQFCYDYPRPCVTVDVVVLTKERRPRVLLIQRKRPPFAGAWALPGGFIDMDETLEESARRELVEETGIQVGKLAAIGVFGDPGRDPRGRTISVVYLARVNVNQVKPSAADDAKAAAWFPLERPPKLAFDHRAILTRARAYLRTLPKH
ncbi:MAG: NUDIX hydrolase [Gemmataceae bacterium]|nr:NUDIX hydrolase [Gemmataceae bacterium]